MKRIATLLLILAAGRAAAEPPNIGRLFTTPAERAGLDRLRDAGGRQASPEPVQATPVAEPQPAPVPPPPPAPISVTGIVTRSDGKSVVWVNGTPQADQAVSTAPGQTPAATVTLPSGQRATVKAGQVVDVTTGAVGDARR